MRLSPTMRETLRAIGKGDVVYDGLFSMIDGGPGTMATIDALERRGLARIDHDHPLPDPGRPRRAYQKRAPIVLTDAGRAAIGA
jgi:hypothetical protein